MRAELVKAGLVELLSEGPSPRRLVSATLPKVDEISRWYAYMQSEGRVEYPTTEKQAEWASAIQKAIRKLQEEISGDPEVRKRFLNGFIKQLMRRGDKRLQKNSALARQEIASTYIDAFLSDVTAAAEFARKRSLGKAGTKYAYPLETDLAKLLFNSCKEQFSDGVTDQGGGKCAFNANAKRKLQRLVMIVMETVNSRRPISFSHNDKAIGDIPNISKEAANAAARNLNAQFPLYDLSGDDEDSDKGRSRTNYYQVKKRK